MDRSKLPYRKNCEGYFLYQDSLVLAQDTGRGYIEFPGGGVGDEDLEVAILRETLEETGARIDSLQQVATIYFDWGTEWAQTDKQEQRYQQFRGEEMHLFIGRVESLGARIGDAETGEDGWTGEVLMSIDEVVGLIRSFKPHPNELKDYYAKQIEYVSLLPKLLKPAF